MPELPEVETIARRLQQLLPEKQIIAVDITKPKSFIGDPQEIIGTRIIAISRRAKILHITLENGKALLVHLKMTGQLIYVDETHRVGGGHPTDDWVKALPSTHTRVVVTLSDQAKLFFNDQRIFGWVKVASSEKVANEFSKLAPDVIDATVTPEYLFAKLQRSNRPIKVVIMDNSIMSGLGNIYACDALNLARISPFRPAKTLRFIEVTTLLAASKEVLNLGITLVLPCRTFAMLMVFLEIISKQYECMVELVSPVCSVVRKLKNVN
jgi:formamidopyrimidine-DNA glycosylase